MAKKKSSGGKRKKANRRKSAAAPAAAKTPKRSHARRAKKSSGGSAPKRSHRKGKKHTRYAPIASYKRKGTVKAHHRRVNPSAAIGLVIAGLAGVGAFLATLVATYYATKNPEKQQTNRKIAAGVVAAIGAVLIGKKRPLLGATVVAGGLLAGFGDLLTMKLIQLLPPKNAPAPTTSAVFEQNMQALVPANGMAAVYEQNMQGYEQIGDFAPPAPWTQPGPFG